MWLDFVQIFSQVLLPVLVLVVIGALLQRCRPMDSDTLVTLNLYFFVPAYLFARILESELSWGDIAQIGLLVMVPMGLAGIPAYICFRLSGQSRETLAAMLAGGLFMNAGNFGVPVVELAFGPEGGKVQALVVMFANLCVFLFGYTILAMGSGGGWRSLFGYFRLPYFYVVVAALALRDSRVAVPAGCIDAARYIANGLVPVALATLGAQLANRANWPRWSNIVPVLILKLVLMPAVTALVAWLFGCWPWPGAILIVSAAAPSAVNVLLLTMQVDGDTETASTCVFWTTLCSALTVATLLAILRACGGMP